MVRADGDGLAILVLIVEQDYSQLIEIDAGDWVRVVSFTADGEHLLSGGEEGVQVWRIKDGKRVAAMQVRGVWSIAVSKDGRFIAVGSVDDVLVWDASTYKRVFAGRIGTTIFDVDFSPDSSRLVSADVYHYTATVWDIATRQKVQKLNHDKRVFAAKYSPQGDRIATATHESVRVWDSDDGRLLVDVKLGLNPLCGLLWFNNHLFVKIKDSKIRQIDASTGSTVSEWPVPGTDSCIALPQHRKFIAYSTGANITFWDTSTHIQLGLIPRSSLTRPSIAFSPDDRLFAIVANRGKIIIKALSLVKVRPGFFQYLVTRERVSLLHT